MSLSFDRSLENLTHYAFIVLIATFFLWALMSLSYPFGWDQGIFAWVGDAINQGEMPYRDAWDIKGPFSYYIYALAQFIFGSRMWAIRVFDLVLLTSCCLALRAMVSQMTSNVVANWAVVLTALAYASTSYWHTAQPDEWAGLMMILAVALLWRPDQTLRWKRPFISGVLIGCITLFKPIFIAFGVVVLVAAILGKVECRNVISTSAALAVGFLSPIVLCALWFSYNNAFDSLVDVWIVYPFEIYAKLNSLSVLSLIRGLIAFTFSGSVASTALPVAGFGAFRLWKQDRRNAIIVLTWAVTAMFVVLLQNRFFLYQWTVIYPPLALLCAYGFYSLFLPPQDDLDVGSLWSKKLRGPLAVIALVLLVFNALLRPGLELGRWSAYLSGVTSKDQYYAAYGIPGADLQAADYIGERTDSNDRILIWGWNSSIYFLSGRRSNSRFGYSMPLLMGVGSRQNIEYRSEFLAALSSDPPAYIVVGPQSEVILGDDFKNDDFREFADILQSNYYEEAAFGDLKIHRRK